MGAIANRLGIRITDGVLFPYTALTERQSDMRPWNGPMSDEWLTDSREARARRLKYIEDDRSRGNFSLAPEVKVFSIATADKDELVEYVANEFGETLDIRLPILILRRQALALAQKQIEAAEAAETAEKSKADEASASTASTDIIANAASKEGESADTRPRGLGRRAA